MEGSGWNGIEEGGHGSDNFSLDVIFLATIQILRTTNTVAVGPICGVHYYCKKLELTLNADEGDMKISVDVKCPKVPHQWGKIGQRMGQLQTVGPFLPATILFKCKKISVYPREKTSHTYFPISIIHKYRVTGDESLYLELSPSPHTHTCTLTDLKSNCCIHLSYRNWAPTVLAM